MPVIRIGGVRLSLPFLTIRVLSGSDKEFLWTGIRGKVRSSGRCGVLLIVLGKR